MHLFSRNGLWCILEEDPETFTDIQFNVFSIFEICFWVSPHLVDLFFCVFVTSLVTAQTNSGLSRGTHTVGFPPVLG